MRAISTVGLALLLSLTGARTAAQSATDFKGRNAAELFAIDHVPKFDITLPDDQWQWLQAHAVEEEPVQAEVRFDGQPAGIAGLRFKGGVGSLERCVDKTGGLKCAKLSFQLNFEKFDSGNRFFGLKRINLHSMNGDPTKLHERLAYDLYQSSGIKAPRSSWAVATVNGKSYGLFSMVEQVDDVFTADRWPGAGNGTLTKEVWPQAGAVNPDALAYMARYMAVDDALDNCDGITAMYTANATSPESTNHNFFWYQEPDGGASWLIPWDMGNTFTSCATFTAVPRWNTVPADCAKSYSVWDNGGFVHAPGCDAVFQAIAARRDDYNAAVDQLLSGPFALEAMLGQIGRWSKFIHDAEVADPTGGGEQIWLASVEDLKKAIPVLRDRLKAFRNNR
jgi:hypothetical protein